MPRPKEKIFAVSKQIPPSCWCGQIRLRHWAGHFCTALARACHIVGASWQREPQWGRGMVGERHNAERGASLLRKQTHGIRKGGRNNADQAPKLADWGGT